MASSSLPYGAPPGGHWADEKFCGPQTMGIACVLIICFWPGACCAPACPCDTRQVYVAPDGKKYIPDPGKGPITVQPVIPSNSSTIVITRNESGKLGLGFQRKDGRSSGPCNVHALAPDGPAEKSGKIKVGDMLYSVNGTNVHNLSIAEIMKLMSGDPETDISLVMG